MDDDYSEDESSAGVWRYVWPILTVILALVIYFFFFWQQSRQAVVYEAPPTVNYQHQLVLANILAAFSDPTLTADAYATTDTESNEQIPIVATDVPNGLLAGTENNQPLLAKKTVVTQLTKTTTKIVLPKPIPKLVVNLNATPAATPATLQKELPKVVAAAPQATTTKTNTNMIPDLFEVAMKGGGSVISGGGGGGGGGLPAPAPAPPVAPIVPPTPTIVVPGAPTALVATASDAQISLSWIAPLDNGGSGLTDYEIRQSTDNFTSSNVIVNDGLGTSSVVYIVTGLTNDTPYYFKVAAVNSVGVGPASNIASTTPVAPPPPPVIVPDAPTALVATAGDAQVALSWAAPASSGSSGLTDYEIHQSNDNFIFNNIILSDGVGTSSTAYIITGLTNSTPYCFKVYAISSAGTGLASGTANATPTAPPPPEPEPEPDEPPPLPDFWL